MNRLVAGGCRLLEALLVLCLALMVLLVFGNVVLRYAFDSGITVSEEISRWLFVWLTFLGAVVAIHERGHLGSDMLVSRLNRRGRQACLVLSHAAMLYVTWLLWSGTLAQVAINREVAAPVTGLSMAVFYASGLVFALLSGVILLHDLWRLATGQLGDDELIAVQESEDLAQVEELHLGQPAKV
ncbi:TRAP transporter small permease [Azohydromonas aeria]|uniref:TRAP transporter small permease n=1 Tax=Azohydromonas aeria TaxID=2590212 RepID=UPI0012F7BE7D|nr:TRAP transporter small permease [Azohydromonas aeria]